MVPKEREETGVLEVCWKLGGRLVLERRSVDLGWCPSFAAWVGCRNSGRGDRGETEGGAKTEGGESAACTSSPLVPRTANGPEDLLGGEACVGNSRSS